MLQNLRERLKGIATLIIVLIAIPFVFVGVDSFFSKGPGDDVAATVNGDNLTELELRRALAIEKQRLVSQPGAENGALPSDGQLRHTVQQRLVREILLSQNARKEGLAVAPVTIAEILQKEAAFQLDGHFNADRYTLYLRQIGYTPQTYGMFLRHQILISQLAGGITGSQFLTTPELELLASLVEQRRDYQYVVIPSAPALVEVQLTDTEIEAYYRDHPASFQSDEQVVVEYLELVADDLTAQIAVDDAQVRERFDAEVAGHGAAERRRVAHILLAATPDHSDDSRLAEIQAKLAAGADFAELAIRHSDDAGSAAQGGDLGFMEAGAFPASFEAAATKLAVGEVSTPVKTDSGSHLIKLLEIDQKPVPIFANEHDRIKKELQRQAAEDLLPAKINELKELAYNAESLAEVGKSLGLTVKVSQPFGRRGGEGIAAFPAVVTAAFSDDVLEKRYTSDVLELGDDRVLVLKVQEHRPAATMPLAEVRDAIAKRLRKTRAQNLLATRADDIVNRVRNGESLRDAAAGLAWQQSTDTRRYGANADRDIRDRAFAMAPPLGKLAQVDRFSRPDGDLVVLALDGVRAGNLARLQAAEQQRLATAASGALAMRDYQAYLDGLIATADIATRK